MRSGQFKLRISVDWLLYLCIFYFFVFRDAIEIHIPIIKYADELVAMLAIPIFLFTSRLKVRIDQTFIKSSTIWIFLFFLSGLLGALIWRYQPLFSITLPAILLNVKFWLAIYTGSYLFRNFSCERYANKLMGHIIFLTWLFTSLIVVDNIFRIFPSRFERYGFPSTQLFYSHPTAFAAVSMFIIACILSIRKYVGHRAIVYFVWWEILMCSTMRSKAIASAMAIALIYYFVYARKKKVRVRTLLLFVPLLLLIGWSQFEYYFLSEIQSGSARYQILVKSFAIARDHPLFGAGFGTFASYYSTVIYSPLYAMYGISNIHGLTEGSASFATDAFWPMVLAETGVIGLFAFVMAVWFLYVRIQDLFKIDKDMYASGLSILAYLLISSLAEAAFVHPLMMPLALWLGFLINYSKSLRV